jgi:hypothetical protein
MTHTDVGALFAIGLFVGMILLLEWGRQIGQRRSRKDEEGARAGLGAVEGAVFALLGLLIAFTFSGAAARFDTRRELIVQEANAIGTAWLRLDLLPATAQPELRGLFRQYLDLRLEAYRQSSDVPAALATLDKANALQGTIWGRAMAACQPPVSPAVAQVIPALNEMFDIASTRTAALRMHPPAVIFVLLGVLALTSSLLAGYAMAGGKSRSWIHVIGFALIMATTIYVILDLEFPRLGMIRVDRMDEVLVEVRRGMN